MRNALIESFEYALARLKPDNLVRPHLPATAPSIIVAVGKAALPMLGAAREAFPEAAWIATPPVSQIASASLNNRSEYAQALTAKNGAIVPGSHPLPDALSVEAADAILAAVGSLRESDSLLLLLSGGGSSLLCAPSGVTLLEKMAVSNSLMHAGADIFELNSVRKHLSRIKGGRLAAATKARILNLVISDVPGDDLGTVASGVSVPDSSTYQDALNVLDKYDIKAPAARRHLLKDVRGEIASSPRPREALWERVESRVVGSNRLLLQTAKEYWVNLGYDTIILSDRFEGEARDIAQAHSDIIESVRSGSTVATFQGQSATLNADLRKRMVALRELTNGNRPIVLLSGGETTVTVSGAGRGGRNQEFALWLLRYLNNRGVWGISVGSDGVDGNSEAAGAVLQPDSFSRALQQGLDLDSYLQRNDSYSFFQALGDSVVTGHTGNNLNDYRAIVVFPK